MIVCLFVCLSVSCIAALLRRTLFFLFFLSLAFSCQTKDVYSNLLDIYRLFRFYKCAAFQCAVFLPSECEILLFLRDPKKIKCNLPLVCPKWRVVRCSFAFACTQIKHKPFPPSCLYDSYQKEINHPTTIRNQKCTSQCSYSLPWLWIEISLFFVFSSFDWCDNSTLESVVVSSQIRITKDSSRQFGFQAWRVCRGKASWGRAVMSLQIMICRTCFFLPVARNKSVWALWKRPGSQRDLVTKCDVLTFWALWSLLQVMGHKKWYVSIFFYLTFMLWTFTVQDGKGGFKIGGVG